MGNSDNSNFGTNCLTCQSLERTEWCALSAAKIESLNKRRVTKEYLSGEAVFYEGDPSRGVFCIKSGLVGVRKTNADGNSVLLYLETPGDTLGYRELLADEDYQTSAEALGPTRICFIDATTVRSLVKHNPLLGLRYLKQMSMSLAKAEEKILYNATLSVRARFAHLLMALLDSFGEGNVKGPTEFELPLARYDLASMIGTTPETMSRTISRMESDGLAQFNGRMVLIPEIETLVQEFDRQPFA